MLKVLKNGGVQETQIEVLASTTNLVVKNYSSAKPLQEDLERRELLLEYIKTHLGRIVESDVVVFSVPPTFKPGLLFSHNKFNED